MSPCDLLHPRGKPGRRGTTVHDLGAGRAETAERRVQELINDIVSCADEADGGQIDARALCGKLAAALVRDRPACRWRETDEAWFTGCGKMWVFTTPDSPAAHGMRYCYHCGKRLTARRKR